MEKILLWQKILVGLPKYGSMPRYISGEMRSTRHLNNNGGYVCDERIDAKSRLDNMLKECNENEQKQILTFNVSSYLIKNVPNFLRLVPALPFIEDLVKENPEMCNLVDIAEELRSYNICLKLVNGVNLNLVPKKYRSIELCNMCIKRNIRATSFNLIPVSCLTKELCFNFLRNCKIATRNGDAGIYVDEISNRLFGLDFCDEAFLEQCVHERIELFLSIPKLYLTGSLCTLAINANSRYILRTPKKYLNKGHFETFTENLLTYNHFTLAFVPKIIERFLMSQCITLKDVVNSVCTEHLNQNIFNIALDIDESNIYFIPDAFITDEMKTLVLAATKVCCTW